MFSKINVNSRFIVQFESELGIHPRTSRRQSLQRGRSFLWMVDQHSRSCVGSLAARFSPLHDQNADAALVELDRKRDPDNPAADDDYIPALHQHIVKDRDESIAKR